jgi:hypothetical protein
MVKFVNQFQEEINQQLHNQMLIHNKEMYNMVINTSINKK